MVRESGVASIGDCRVGVRVRFTDGWGGPASVIGRRHGNLGEGSLAAPAPDGMAERDRSDIVQVRFAATVRNGSNHKIVAVSCQPGDLTILEDDLTD